MTILQPVIIAICGHFFLDKYWLHSSRQDVNQQRSTFRVSVDIIAFDLIPCIEARKVQKLQILWVFIAFERIYFYLPVGNIASSLQPTAFLT